VQHVLDGQVFNYGLFKAGFGVLFHGKRRW
jgi:hypothetical protein